MNLKTTSAKLMSIILTVVMLVGMMPAGIALAEEETPIYSCTVEDIDLYLPAGYTSNDVYALSNTELHDGKNLRTIKVTNTGNQYIFIYHEEPTLTDKSTNFDDTKIWVKYLNDGASSSVAPGNTESYRYMEIATGLEPGVYTATINVIAQTREEDVNGETGSVTATANFKLTVGDHNWATEWTSDAKEHWHACTDSGCTARKDVAAHNSDKVGTDAKAATFDTDGSTGTKYCSVCDTKMAEAQPIAAGKYIRESKATMTPAAITDAMCANDLVFTSLESTKYSVALWRVFDLTTGGAAQYSKDTKFIAGHEYAIEFQFTAVGDYVYEQVKDGYTSTFFLNGEPADMSKVTSLAGGVHRRVVLTATASGTTPTPGHTHAWATTWSKDSTHHWHDCTATGCDVTDNSKKDGYATHTYDKEVATADYLANPATCQAKATYYKSCICGAKGTETFESGDKAAHDFSGEYYYDATGHGKKCVTTGCKEHATLVAHDYDGDTDTTCNICGYVRTITTTPTQVSSAKFAMTGYAIGSKIVNTTVTPDSTNTGINYGDATNNKYGGYYVIHTDSKILENKADSVVEADSTAVFEKDKNYYLVIYIYANSDYSLADLTAAQVTLDGVGAASKLVRNDSQPGVAVTAIFTLPELTEAPTTSYTITFDANEGTVSPATATTGADGKLATLPEPTRSNYKFVGWFTAKSGGEQVTTSTVFTKDTTIYAQWKLKSTGGGGGSIVYKTLTFETNGGSYLDSITRNQGANVSLKEYKPTKSDYVFAGWYSDKKLTKKITTVSLDQDTTVYAAWQKNTPAEPVQTEPFVDVDVNDWFYDDVVYAYNNGLMGGMSANIFNPNVPTTRGMIVTILYRMENEPAINGIMPFNDVKAGSYYEKAILWAVGNNIVSGYGNGIFGPDDVITREQMASILWRYAQYKGYDVSIGEDTNILSYDDALSISAYAMPAMQWACGDGIIGGTTANTLSPQGQATRAQTAAILHRFCDKIGR